MHSSARSRSVKTSSTKVKRQAPGLETFGPRKLIKEEGDFFSEEDSSDLDVCASEPLKAATSGRPKFGAWAIVWAYSRPAGLEMLPEWTRVGGLVHPNQSLNP